MCVRGAGCNLPDWAEWGGNLDAYAPEPGSGTAGDQAGSQEAEPSKPRPGTVAWSLQCALALF